MQLKSYKFLSYYHVKKISFLKTRLFDRVVASILVRFQNL